jgi:NitT/TauT family transport system substrate-binding protein
VIAYNAYGAATASWCTRTAPYYELADLKGKLVSVPFGSAAHGMMLQSHAGARLPENFWNLVSPAPEIGTTNLQEKRIDAHGDFVPFAELLRSAVSRARSTTAPRTKIPTFHGVIVRKDFAEKFPEVVHAYIKALMEANDWFRKNPKLAAEKVEEWTKIEKEVVYMFLGPGGVHTLDPTIKPRWIDTIKIGYGVLKKLDRVKEFNVEAWVNDKYVRDVYKENRPRLRRPDDDARRATTWRARIRSATCP